MGGSLMRQYDKCAAKKPIHQYNLITIQPSFEFQFLDYIESKNYGQHLKSVSMYYQFESNYNNNIIPVVPDGCIDILFCCDLENYFAEIYGSVCKKKKISFKSGCTYFGVRFFPGFAGPMFKNISLSEFTETSVLFCDFFNRKHLPEKITEVSTFQKRIKYFEKFYIDVIKNTTSVPENFIQILYTTLKGKGNIKIEDLSRKVGYSERYIQKKFKEFVGISPKLFNRIIRFQNSLYQINSDKESKLIDIALDNGYYDQAHFNREFKEFSSIQPQKLLYK